MCISWVVMSQATFQGTNYKSPPPQNHHRLKSAWLPGRGYVNRSQEGNDLVGNLGFSHANPTGAEKTRSRPLGGLRQGLMP